MILRQHQIGPARNFTYIVADGPDKEGVVIDPSYGIEPVLRDVDALGVKVRFILNTHGHPDHIAGNEEVRARTGAKVAAHRASHLTLDRAFDNGDVLKVGPLAFQVLHTPGHTLDSVLYVFHGQVATGDTLFVGECGRTDLPGGSPESLYDSLFGTVVKLPEDTVVLPGHDYGATPTSTIGFEKLHNYVLQPRSREAFVRFLREP